jgi:hypothetical protein
VKEGERRAWARVEEKDAGIWTYIGINAQNMLVERGGEELLK